MHKRALFDILPNLFETAALYEDHFARYRLYEGTGRTDPGHGTHVTWHRLTRPPRKAAPPRKRGRQIKARAPRMESDDDASGGESEVDDTTTRAHLQRTRQAQNQPQQPQNPSVLVSRQHAPDIPAPTVPAGASAPSASQQDPHVLSSTTSNIPFGQHMYDLCLNEEIDAKIPSHARQNDEVLV
jgi:hypothetical protein